MGCRSGVRPPVAKLFFALNSDHAVATWPVTTNQMLDETGIALESIVPWIEWNFLNRFSWSNVCDDLPFNDTDCIHCSGSLIIRLTNLPKDRIIFGICCSLISFISYLDHLVFFDFANEATLDGTVWIKRRKQLYDRGMDPWTTTPVNALCLLHCTTLTLPAFFQCVRLFQTTPEGIFLFVRSCSKHVLCSTREPPFSTKVLW